jgi:hypothetical protein
VERSSLGGSVQSIASRPKIRIFTLFLIVLSILGAALVFINTSTYGPGISGDGMDYISAADNLSSGKGLVDLTGDPYLRYPPLYPALLAGFHLLTALDTILIGRIFNIICFGMTIYATGILLRRCFPDQMIWPSLGAFLVLFYLPYVATASNIASDPLFIVMVLGLFLASHEYVTTTNRAAFWAMLVISALGPLHRFIGATLIAVSVIAVFIVHRNRLRLGLLKASLVGLATSLPIALWTFGRNYLNYGTMTGETRFRTKHILENTAYYIRAITRWFIPLSVTQRIPFWIIPALLLVLLLLVGRRRHWAAFLGRFSRSPLIFMVLFSAAYILSTLLTITPLDHLNPYDDRYQAVIFVPILAILFYAVQDLVITPLQERNIQWIRPVAIVLILIWSIYPIFTVYKYVLKSVQQGEIIYNLYNLKEYNDSPVIHFLKEYPPGSGVPLYSNLPEVTYLFIRQTTKRAPHDIGLYGRTPQYLLEHYLEWPEEEMAYLIWIRPNPRQNYYPPDELSSVADVEVLFQTRRRGGVYLIRPKTRP